MTAQKSQKMRQVAIYRTQKDGNKIQFLGLTRLIYPDMRTPENTLAQNFFMN